MGTKYASRASRQKLADRIDNLERTIANPALHNTVQMETIKRNLKEDKKRLDAVTPPPVTDSERRQLEQRESQLVAFLRHQMPTRREMQQDPQGAADKEVYFQHYSKEYTVDPNGDIRRVQKNEYGKKLEQGAVYEYKDIKRRLNGEEEEFNSLASSIEAIRPVSDSKNSDGLGAYRSRSFSMPRNMAEIMGTADVSPIQQYMAKVDAGEAPASVAAPGANIAQPKPAGFEQCPCTNKKGERCINAIRPGKKSCWVKAHQIAVGDMLPKAQRG